MPVNLFEGPSSPKRKRETRTWVEGAKWRDAIDPKMLARAQNHPDFGSERTAKMHLGWTYFTSDEIALRCPHCNSDDGRSDWFDQIIKAPDAVVACPSCEKPFRGDDVVCEGQTAFGAISIELGEYWVELSNEFVASVGLAAGCTPKLIWNRS